MKSCYALLTMLLLLAVSCAAQNYVTISASHIKNGGVLVAAGTLCFTATDQQDNVLTGYKAGDGQQISRPVCSPIISGVVTSFSLANGDLTVPQNVLFRATVTLASQNQPVLYYKGVQTSANNSWCATAACNFDNFNPSNGLIFPQYAGPPGATGPQGATGATGPPGSGSYLPGSIVDPYVDGRTQSIDCTGASDSSAGFVAWLLGGHKRKEVPGDCKIQIAASSGHGAIITGITGLGSSQGWIDIFGGNGAEIFGCGAGTGAVLNFNRSGYFRFHGFTVQPTDTTLCGGGSTFTRDIDWTNNGGGGVTSTKAEFDHLRLLSNGLPSGGVLFPSLGFGLAANNGNNVLLIDGLPSWPNFAVQQVTGTNIVNTTAYSASAQVAIAGGCCGTQLTGQALIRIGKCTANCTSLTPTVSVLATSSPCAINSTNSWAACTVNYTGTVGDAGVPLVLLLVNSSTVASGKFNQVWFDNVTCTNFTCSNGSFETLNYGAVLSSGAFLSPAVGSSWNWANFPQFIGLQVGAFGGDQNLEDLHVHDIDIDGAMSYNSIGLFDQGCCSEHNVISNVGMFSLWRGIQGAMPWPVITNLHGGGSEGANQFNAQVFGVPGGALIASPIGGELINLNWDGFGPTYNSTGSGTTTNAVPTFVNPQISGTVHAPGEYDIDISFVANATFTGGVATNLAGAALNNTENAFVGMSAWTGNSCCGDAYGLQTIHFQPSGLNGAVIKGAHVLMHGLVANGTAVLGTSAISAGTCAPVVTVSAPGVNTQGAAGIGNVTDAIAWAFTTAPSGAYTQGLTIQPYTTIDNVNFLVCNPTAGSLTPPAKTISWSVNR